MTLRRKPQGRLWLHDNVWHLTAAPHVCMALKRTFPRVEIDKQQFCFKHTARHCWELRWFIARYPLDVIDQPALDRGAAEYERVVAELEHIDSPSYEGRVIPLAFPLRKYQAKSVDIFNHTGHLIVGDDLGLGKTVTGLGTLTVPKACPAAVVTYSHLQLQWHREVRTFLPGAIPHIIRSRELYDPCVHTIHNRTDKVLGRCVSIDGVRMSFAEHLKWCRDAGVTTVKRGQVTTRVPDVFILTYSKLNDWADWLARICGTIIYDECQELRRDDSNKYSAACRMSHNVPRNLLLSATPIYNMGGEAYNVVSVMAPGALGSWAEFCREWCTGESSERGKVALKDPVAFGSYLRSEYLMVRHSRADVGRELPALSRYTQLVDADQKALDKVSDAAAELARIILGNDEKRRKGIDLMQAGGEFINLLRRSTGIAKAPHVAAFVKLMLEQDTPVILSGWHRTVYEIWNELLADYKPAMYTGSESDQQKDRARARFMKGDTNLLILSNRSGAGLHGLQERCATAVIGELDWSHGPHKQFIGRVHREGQKQPVFAYFVYCDAGSDPVMMDVLGLKEQQHKGVMDPWASDAPEPADTGAMQRAILLAQCYLQKTGAA
jgi:hypothetical protein